MLIATVLLIPIVHWEARSQQARLPSIPGSDWLRFLLIGVLGQVVAQLFITWELLFFFGLQCRPADVGAAHRNHRFMAYFLLGETMSRIRWISFALAIAGVVECSGVDWKALDFTGKGYLLGNVLIFISVCGSAFYNVYSKKLLERYTPLQVILQLLFRDCLSHTDYALCRAWRLSPNRFLHCEDLARDCSARGVSVLSLDGNFSFGVNPSRCDPGQLVQLHDPVLWPRHCCSGAA